MERAIDMLTFEKVLEVFEPYLEKDTICEIVKTKQGYTIMYWDTKATDWYAVIYCKNPEIMRDALLDSYYDELERSYTKNQRNLTKEERNTITTVVDEMKQKCNE